MIENFKASICQELQTQKVRAERSFKDHLSTGLNQGHLEIYLAVLECHNDSDWGTQLNLGFWNLRFKYSACLRALWCDMVPLAENLPVQSGSSNPLEDWV